MKNIGVYLILTALASVVINMFGYELGILAWIDNWGEQNGWYIRGVAIFVGSLLWMLSDYITEQNMETQELGEQA